MLIVVDPLLEEEKGVVDFENGFVEDPENPDVELVVLPNGFEDELEEPNGFHEAFDPPLKGLLDELFLLNGFEFPPAEFDQNGLELL